MSFSAGLAALLTAPQLQNPNEPFPRSNDGTEFGGSIYQKVNEELETAVTLAWTAGSNNTRFGIAAKYKLDKDASLSVSYRRVAGRASAWTRFNRVLLPPPTHRPK